jgi:hypothetical protein
MEGAPTAITPTELPIDELSADGWQIALRAPGLAATSADRPITLHDSQAVLFTRRSD